MPPRQAVSFSGPALPPFLARLQAQVAGSAAASSSERTLDPLLEARRKAKREEVEERRRKRAESGQVAGPEDEDDEFDGAQVVVLDENNDLSREQALQGHTPSAAGEQAGDSGPSAPASKSAHADIATPGLKRKADDQAGPLSSGKAARTKGLDVLADEIAGHKRPQQKAEDKEKQRKEKNKRAAKEKKKAGKGLSFDLD